MNKYPLLYYLGKMILLAYAKIVTGFKVKNKEMIPDTGSFIIASNHISWFDPPLVGIGIKRVCNFMAKRELFNNRFFATILRNVKAIPVNRAGFDRTSIKNALEALKRGEGLVMFPEGTRSKDGEIGKMRLGVGLLAVKSNATVIPAYIKNSKNSVRNRLTGKKVVVTFGEPIPIAGSGEYPNSKEGYQKIADEVEIRIRDMKRNLN
ncbi:MAG: 1-acyl-sn-glycerol-3-phosphate acyltransferase [candidate division Zixibacteria bacterium]|nr:1-acyl-sn-glycerol-3-phosphate acyltransferase [candidate division Zixibacteria bacterium]